MKVTIRYRTRRDEILYIICKWIVAAFYLYINWFKEVWGNQPILLYGLTLLLTVLIAIDCLRNRKIAFHNFPAILKTYFIFGAYALVTGFFTAANQGVLVSSIVTFMAFSAMCFYCWYICDKTNQTDWILLIFAMCAVVCSIQVIFFGVAYQNETVVIAMSKTNNPNYLSLTVFFGIYAVTAHKTFLRKHFVIGVGLLSVFFYVIILSGSRKSFLISAAYIIAWFIIYIRSDFGRKITVRATLQSALLVLAAAVAIMLFNRYFSNTSMYKRLLIMIDERTDNVRFYLYREAFEYWRERPLFGIGFAQFALRTRYRFYSHSSYAEILACTGAIGFLIFYVPFFRLTGRSFWRIGDKEQYHRAMLAVLFFAELVFGAGTIFIYNFPHMLVLTYIFYMDKTIQEFDWRKRNAA